MGAADTERRSFFDEQRRRRRAVWLLSSLCLLIAAGIGVVLSSVVTPLLLLAGGGLLHALAAMGVAPVLARQEAHAIGAWAAHYEAGFGRLVDSLDQVNGLGDLGVTIMPLLGLLPVAVPALVAAAVVWLMLRHLALRGAGDELIARTHARLPNPQDLEERQLGNIVAEMAIAAGLPAPTLRLIDSPEINAAAIGRSPRTASVLVTRGALDRLDRDETSGLVAHLIAAIGAGDLRLTHSILAVFQTLGFFLTFLDLPFRWSAWQALGGLTLVAIGVRRAPEAVAATMDAVERGMTADTMPDVDTMWSAIPWQWLRKLLLVPLLPLLLVSLLLRLVLFLWCSLLLGPPLALIWRNRRYAADAMAVQLARNADGLARALAQIAGSAAMPEGGEGREYCFIHGPAAGQRRGAANRHTITVSLHPSLQRRVQRLQALGASGAAIVRPRLRLALIAEYPGRALLVAGLLALLLPLGGVLLLLVAWLTAVAMMIGLAVGLAIAAGVLG